MAERTDGEGSDAAGAEIDGYAIASLVIGTTSLLSLDRLLSILVPAGFAFSATIFLIPIAGLFTSVIARRRLRESTDLRGRVHARSGRQFAIAGGLLSGLVLLVLVVGEVFFDPFVRIAG